MPPSVDGVQKTSSSGKLNAVAPVDSNSVNIRLSEEAPKARPWYACSLEDLIGIPVYIAILYCFYAGFMAAMIVIAVAVRKDNYMRLNNKLTGSPIASGSYTTPWLALQGLLQPGVTRG